MRGLRRRVGVDVGVLLAAALAAGPALAEWQTATGISAQFCMGVASPDGVNVFAVGTSLDTSTTIPTVVGKVFSSADGGALFADITADLDNGRFVTLEAIAFGDASHGCVAGGGEIHCTRDRGVSWQQTRDTQEVITGLHLLDAQRGFAVGEGGLILRTQDGGSSWSQVSSPTEVALRHQFWLDAQRGWISGCELEAQESGEPIPGAGVLLRTTDGGASWSQQATFSGRGLGPVFFLGDGQTGWLATWTRQDEEHTLAVLSATQDGGATFADLGLPLEVGTMDPPFGSDQPIHTSRLHGMHWSDARHGRLVGDAFIQKLEQGSGGGGGGSTSTVIIARIIDYLTDDGGATWQRTDVGTYTFSLSMTDLPPTDESIMGGRLHDQGRGWLAGTKGVFRYTAGCAVPADCPNGYSCEAGTCLPVAAGQDAGAGSDAAGVDRGTVGADGGAADSAGGGAGSDAAGEGAGFEDLETGGCGCGAPAAGASPHALALLALCFATARRARRRG